MDWIFVDNSSLHLTVTLDLNNICSLYLDGEPDRTISYKGRGKS